MCLKLTPIQCQPGNALCLVLCLVECSMNTLWTHSLPATHLFQVRPQNDLMDSPGNLAVQCCQRKFWFHWIQYSKIPQISPNWINNVYLTMGNQPCWPTSCMCVCMTENYRYELKKVQRNSVNVFLGKMRNFSFSWSPRMGWVQAGDVGMYIVSSWGHSSNNVCLISYSRWFLWFCEYWIDNKAKLL